MSNLTEFEYSVLNALLDGENQKLSNLRNQLQFIQAVEREVSTAGFYTNFQVSRDVNPLLGSKSFQFGDVHVDLPELEGGMGFLLYIKDGYLNMLEGYTYEEKMPEEIKSFKIRYIGDSERKLDEFFR